MDTFVGGDKHRTVYWLGAPTLGTDSMDRGAFDLGQVMKAEAAKRTPDVVYVDTYKLFSVESGEYSRYILDEHGDEITARIGDGVHFSEDGAAYLARAVFSLLDTRFELQAHAGGEPIGWSLADGSGETVPGYTQRPRSRYRDSSSDYTPVTDEPDTPSVTEPPVTSPPATSPPETSPPQTSPPATSPPATSPPVTSPPHT
jgi:hypothetical protein